jgi:hypothetical protein
MIGLGLSIRGNSGVVLKTTQEPSGIPNKVPTILPTAESGKNGNGGVTKDPIVENALAKAAERLGVPDVDLSRVRAVPMPAGVMCRNRPALGCFRAFRVTLPNGEVREYGRLEYSMTKPGSIGGPPMRKVLAHEAIPCREVGER